MPGVCSECGDITESRPRPGLCAGCGRENTYFESRAETGPGAGPLSLADDPGPGVVVVPTGVDAFDAHCRGVPLGAIFSLYGRDGSGKSTLAMQIVTGLALALEEPALLVCPEMSRAVLGLICERGGLGPRELGALHRAEDPENWEEEARALGARLVLVDSVSKMPRPREALARLIAYTRETEGAGVALAYQAKDGTVLGPVALRHEPDAVFRLTRQPEGARLLRVEKSRWCETGAIVLSPRNGPGGGRRTPKSRDRAPRHRP